MNPTTRILAAMALTGLVTPLAMAKGKTAGPRKGRTHLSASVRMKKAAGKVAHRPHRRKAKKPGSGGGDQPVLPNA
jgi:hypothetical protein